MPVKVSRVAGRPSLVVSAALAGPSTDKARSAKAHIDTGNAYFNLEKYKEAIGEFEQAYLDKQDPATFFNIAECHRLLGNNAEAMRFLRRFLQETNNHPNRVKAEERLTDLERAAATAPPVVAPPRPAPTSPAAPPAPVSARPLPPGSTVASPPSSASPPPVSPGPPPPSWSSSASPSPPPPPTQPVPAAIMPPSAPEPSAVTIAAAPPPARTSTPIYKKWWFWTAIGVAVVGGTVAGLVATSSPSRPGCPAGVVCQ